MSATLLAMVVAVLVLPRLMLRLAGAPSARLIDRSVARAHAQRPLALGLRARRRRRARVVGQPCRWRRARSARAWIQSASSFRQGT
jgi:hypothetical protein